MKLNKNSTGFIGIGSAIEKGLRMAMRGLRSSAGTNATPAYRQVVRSKNDMLCNFGFPVGGRAVTLDVTGTGRQQVDSGDRACNDKDIN